MYTYGRLLQISLKLHFTNQNIIVSPCYCMIKKKEEESPTVAAQLREIV